MRRVLATLTCLAAVAAPARGAEFVPGMEAYGVWDSNVFHTSENEESAFSTLAGPILELREKQGSLLYDVKFTTHYEAFPSISGINDFQYFVDANGSYRFPDGRTTLTVTNYFSKASSAVQLFNSEIPTTTGLLQLGQLQVGREELLYNTTGVTLSHWLTPLWQLSSSFNYTLSEFLGNKQLGIGQFNTTSFVGSAQVTRTLSPRASAGFGSSVTRQDFEQKGISGRGATFYSAFGILSYQITPTLTFQGSAGPAIYDPDKLNEPTQLLRTALFPTNNGNLVNVTTCPFEGSFRVFDPSNPNRCQAIFGTAALAQAINQPRFVPVVGANQISSPQSTLTYYGHLALTKKWETLTAVLSYDRSTSTASGLGTSTNVDSVGGSLVWTPTSMWSLTLTSSYSLQTSAGKTQQPLLAVTPLCQVVNTTCIPGTVGALAAATTGVTSKLVSNGFEFTTYRVGLNVSRKLTKRLTLIGIGDWYRQENTGSISAQSNLVSDIRLQLGFTYTWDPIPLWTKDF